MVIQPVLEVGKEDDEHEKEANHVADKVMRMKETDEEEESPLMHTPGAPVKKMHDPGAGIKKMPDAVIRRMSDGITGGMAAPRQTAVQKAPDAGNPPRKRDVYIKGEATSVDILDINGKVINTLAIETTEGFLISLGDETPPGIYLLRFKLKDGTEQTQRMTKMEDTGSIGVVHIGEETVGQNDPSRMSDNAIRDTVEYENFYKKSSAESNEEKDKQALLAARLMLRDKNAGVPVTGDMDYLDQAVRQSGVLNAMESSFSIGNHATGETGEFKWSGEHGKVVYTDFSRWIRGYTTTEPDPCTTTNNCFGVILYGAIRSGYVDKAWVNTYYDNVVSQISTNINAFDDLLRGGNQIYNYDVLHPDTSPNPLPGDLVIFDSAAGHIVIATGNIYSDGSPEIISLWDRPNNTRFLQRTSIKALVDAGANANVKFFSPVWK